jgi:ribonuclease P protein component
VVSGCLVLNWAPLPPATASRLGVVTSGKLGQATVRSRSRRLLREAFRLHQHHLNTAVDAVLVARASIVGRGLAGVERDYVRALRQAGLWQQTP